MDESLAKASLLDGYRVAGFRVRARIKPHVRDPTGLVITLARREKKPCAAGAGKFISASTTVGPTWRAISPAAIVGSIWSMSCVGLIARPVG
jgi:hypothetical protein